LLAVDEICPRRLLAMRNLAARESQRRPANDFHAGAVGQLQARAERLEVARQIAGAAA
jgi:hypothetical protein